jgi:hypothetical protein
VVCPKKDPVISISVLRRQFCSMFHQELSSMPNILKFTALMHIKNIAKTRYKKKHIHYNKM